MQPTDGAPAANGDDHAATAARIADAVCRSGVALVPLALTPAVCDAVQHAAQKRVTEVLERLHTRGLKPLDADCVPFTYAEAASRCPGRVDVRFGNPSSLPSPLVDLGADTLLGDVCQRVLGKDARVLYAGVVVSGPGSDDQGWHVDGDHLSDGEHLPPHALTVFLAPVDVTEPAGLPEFFVGSHVQRQAQKLTEGLEPVDPPITLPLARGSAIVFDYRIVHRGTGNRSSTDRPLPYLVVARGGWEDSVNFNKSASLFDSC
eukprot:m.215745 g.215745  ORF g.215745 m.215745 type:complete len:261 (+) comp28024_c0_seq1:61-843(+)